MKYPVNSLFYWFPLIKDLGIPMPETVMVPFPTKDTLGEFQKLFDGPCEPKGWLEYVKLVGDACDRIGYPVFLRTDETSHKHGWKDTCYLTGSDDIPDHLYELLEFTEMAGWLGGLSIHGYAVRRFLELDVKFTAFHGDMPVATEFRFFVRDGKLQCWHPYWFPACMVRPSVEGWYGILIEMEKLSNEDLAVLTEWAEKIGGAVGGYWSIDFCKLKDGSWAMTDMANGDNSFHFTTCPHCPEDMRKAHGDPYTIERKTLSDYISVEETKKRTN